MNDQTANDRIRITTIAQLAKGDAWRMEKLHSHDFDLLLWLTRGQGRANLLGMRRGVGTHNAIFLPADTLYALDLGQQGFGQAVAIPRGAGLGFPDELTHLRIRDVQAQGEITGIVEAMQRESDGARPFAREAIRAEAALMSVWIRRQMINAEAPPKPTGAQRLIEAFTALVAREYRSGKTMADYAGMLGVTPTHLTRTSKDCCDMTAAEILTECTLYGARDLIERSDMPFQVIAAEMGFGSAAYFTRFVQSHTNATPSELRRRREKTT